jgi:hypothetical protein
MQQQVQAHQQQHQQQQNQQQQWMQVRKIIPISWLYLPIV